MSPAWWAAWSVKRCRSRRRAPRARQRVLGGLGAAGRRARGAGAAEAARDQRLGARFRHARRRQRRTDAFARGRRRVAHRAAPVRRDRRRELRGSHQRVDRGAGHRPARPAGPSARARRKRRDRQRIDRFIAKDFNEILNVFVQNLVRLSQQVAKCRIDNVCRSQSVVNPFALRLPASRKPL